MSSSKLLFVKTVEKTWPGLGVGEGQGCRGEGVGQGPGMWSMDSIDHQKPGESCWGERRGWGVVLFGVGAEGGRIVRIVRIGIGIIGISMEHAGDGRRSQIQL